MDRTPNELLSQVFVECLPHPDYDGPYLQPSTTSVPLVLLQVCRRWRVVALQTQRLWCSLNAAQGDVVDAGLDAVNSARIWGYGNWLSRSGGRPLSLAISFQCDSCLRERLIHVLKTHKNRLQCLRVTIAGPIDLEALLNGANTLASLSVNACFSGSRILTATLDLPTLHTLALSNTYAGQNALTNSTWANLTRLAVKLPVDQEYELRDFHHLLRLCPNLQNLIFGCSTFSLSNPTDPCFHPNLRFFTFIAEDIRGLQPAHSLLDQSPILCTPALMSLRVQSNWKHGFDLEQELVEDDLSTSTLSQRGCDVELADVWGFQLVDIPWLTLSHLRVKVSEIKHDVNIETVLLYSPQLHTLEFFAQGTTFPTSAFTSFTNASLRNLVIKVNAPLGDIFQQATLSGLENLTVVASFIGEHSHIFSFLTRSRCLLTSLKICSFSGTAAWTSSEKESLCSLIPTLTEVELKPYSSGIRYV